MYRAWIVSGSVFAGLIFYLVFEDEIRGDDSVQNLAKSKISSEAPERNASTPSIAVAAKAGMSTAFGVNTIENRGQDIVNSGNLSRDLTGEANRTIAVGPDQDVDDLSVFKNLPPVNVGSPLDIDDLSVYESLPPVAIGVPINVDDLSVYEAVDSIHIGVYKSEDEIYDEFYNSEGVSIVKHQVVDIDTE